MDKDNLEELLESRAQTDQELGKLRAPMTILFSDIKGSTRYAEKKGDVEYVAMINRHNVMLFPIIEREGGLVVKTIGDSILAKFDDPVCAIKAAVGMQRALAEDREGREEIDQIRIRIGMHHGMGLMKDKDVFGDVVNAASRVEHQADAEQVLITGVLVEAARLAGFDCAKMGRADLKGKDEPIDLYAVAWSESYTQQLIAEIQAGYEKKLTELRKQLGNIEEEYAIARDQWRADRRGLMAEIEKLEESIQKTAVEARERLSADLQSELRFKIDELRRARDLTEQDLASFREQSEAERTNLKAQIVALQGSVVDAMERANNPGRVSVVVREQVDARLENAKREWQLQWEAERKRLMLDIERLKKGVPITDEKKEAARRALLEKLGKRPAGSSGPPSKSAEQWEREFEATKIEWETERERLDVKVRKFEFELQRKRDEVREEILQEMRTEYQTRLTDANRELKQLKDEVQTATSELATERQRLNARNKALEDLLPQAQEAARKQAMAELQTEFESRIEEAHRLRTRADRKHQDLFEEFEAEKRRSAKQIQTLEDQLKEARQAAFRAQKSAGESSSE